MLVGWGAPWGMHSHQATVSGQGVSLEARGPGDHPSLEVCRDRCSSHTFHYDCGLKKMINTAAFKNKLMCLKLTVCFGDLCNFHISLSPLQVFGFLIRFLFE